MPILRGNDKNAYDREKRVGSSVAKVRIICIPKSSLGGYALYTEEYALHWFLS